MSHSVKTLLPNKTSPCINTVKTKDGFTSSAKETANEFNNYFTSVGATLAEKFNTGNVQSNVYTSSSTNDSHSSFNFDCITSVFVYNHICDFSNNKSPGIDGFNVKLLKLAAPYICHSLAYICNLSLRTSAFPANWKIAKVTPIFKAGDKSDISNYRPISVLPIISKIIERAVHNQLYSYLTSKGLLSANQSGFRANHSTTTTLLDVQDFILNNMNNGRATGVIFLDLKKAFDCVNHSLLIDKLSEIGIKGKKLDWFRSYLSNRTQAVKIDSTLSDFKNIGIGVPQGSILGPLFFIIFVNSLANSVNCKCNMYADDSSLLCTADNPAALQSELQKCLFAVSKWFDENKLTLNIPKTKYRIRPNKRPGRLGHSY